MPRALATLVTIVLLLMQGVVALSPAGMAVCIGPGGCAIPGARADSTKACCREKTKAERPAPDRRVPQSPCKGQCGCCLQVPMPGPETRTAWQAPSRELADAVTAAVSVDPFPVLIVAFVEAPAVVAGDLPPPIHPRGNSAGVTTTRLIL